MSVYTPASFESAILTAFDGIWQKFTPVAYPNEPFDPTGLTKWARFSIQGDGASERIGGSNSTELFIRSGLITIQCFAKEKKSTDDLNTMIDLALSFLEVQKIAGVLFSDVSPPQEIGPDGPWFQVAVTARWRYFTKRAN